MNCQLVTTNTPSNTAVRGPGIAQAIIIGETMMEHLAAELGVDAEEFRKTNMMTEGETTMGGLPLAPTAYTLPRIWSELTASSEIEARKATIAGFNKANKWVKRGIAMTPVRYSLTPGLNAGVVCLINVHGADPAGPFVEVHHGGIEMGQGLSTKVQQMIAIRLGVPIDNIHVHPTSTAVIPNMGIIGGSIGSETTVAAAAKACDELLARLEPVKEMIKKVRAPRLAVRAHGFISFISIYPFSLLPILVEDPLTVLLFGVSCRRKRRLPQTVEMPMAPNPRFPNSQRRLLAG